MVVMLQVVAAESCDSVKLMVFRIWECPSGCNESAVERIVRMIHLVAAEHLFEASFVKGFVVGNQRQVWTPCLEGFLIAEPYEFFYFLPYRREHGSTIRIFTTKAVYSGTEPVVIIWLRLDQRIKRVSNLSVTDNDDTYTANTGSLVVCSFKIYCRKISHKLLEERIKDGVDFLFLGVGVDVEEGVAGQHCGEAGSLLVVEDVDRFVELLGKGQFITHSK